MKSNVSRAAPLALVAALFVCAAVIDTEAKSAPNGRDCFNQLERGRGAEIVCEFPTLLSDDEKKELKRLTREMLQDARCVVSIRIERRQIDEALAADDYEFIAPAQPVKCELIGKDRTIEITGTFAPRVVFVAGRAIVASPGLANVEGVSPALAWPVLQYVNRAGSIQEGMLQVVNAWRAHMSIKREIGQR